MLGRTLRELYPLTTMQKTVILVLLGLSSCLWNCLGQSLGNAGTIEGTVVDQSGAAIPKAEVRLSNAVTGYTQTTIATSDGSFRLGNIPPNPYRLEVNASGFGTYYATGRRQEFGTGSGQTNPGGGWNERRV